MGVGAFLGCCVVMVTRSLGKVVVVTVHLRRMTVVTRVGDERVMAMGIGRVIVPVRGDLGEPVRVHHQGHSVEGVAVLGQGGVHPGVLEVVTGRECRRRVVVLSGEVLGVDVAWRALDLVGMGTVQGQGVVVVTRVLSELGHRHDPRGAVQVESCAHHVDIVGNDHVEHSVVIGADGKGVPEHQVPVTFFLCAHEAKGRGDGQEQHEGYKDGQRSAATRDPVGR